MPSGTVVGVIGDGTEANFLSGITVTATLRPPGGTKIDTGDDISNQTTISDAGGNWSFNLEQVLNIEPAGSYWEIVEAIPGQSRVTAVQVPGNGVYNVNTVRVPNVGFPIAAPIIQTLTAQLLIVQGNNQTITGNTTVPVQLVVSAVDGNNQPVVSDSVTFTIVPGPNGGTASFAGGGLIATVLTNTQGQAVCPVFTVNNTADTITIQAVEANLGLQVTFSEIVAPPLVPAAPTITSATQTGNNTVTIAFTPGATNGANVVGYTFFIFENGLQIQQLITAQSNPRVFGPAPSVLVNGHTYTFTAAAVTSQNITGPQSAPSGAVAIGTGATGPGAPAILTVTAPSAGSELTATWQAPTSDGGSAITNYTLQAFLASDGVTHEGVDFSGNVLTGTVTGLANGTAYVLKVFATNGVGNGPASVASASTTPATFPAAPTGAAGTTDHAQSTITWTPGANNGSAVLSSTVKIYLNGGAYTGITATLAGTGTSLLVTGLTNGTAYQATVFETNAVGPSAESARSASFTPTLPAPTVSGVTPNFAGKGNAGSTTVTVTGSNFVTGATVSFGIYPATSVVVVGPNQISCQSPVGPGGTTQHVQVTTTSGTSSTTSADLFTFLGTTISTVIGDTPAEGTTAGGDAITIAGVDFTGATDVKFGGTDAGAPVVVNDRTLTLNTPASTEGFFHTFVTTPAGTSAQNPNDLFQFGAAVVTVAPNSGTVAGGTNVTITGRNFTSATGVTFFGSAATNFLVVNDNTITCTTPAHAAGQTNALVQSPKGNTIVGTANRYTYQTAGTPVVTGVSPLLGSTGGGTSVTVTGINFSGTTAVQFGANPATGLSITSTSITCTAPAGTGIVDVTVVNPTGTSITNGADQYNYGPILTSVSPRGSSSAGGDLATLTGVGFTGATAVSFGATPAAAFTVVSDNTITATAPSAAGGAVALTVTAPLGVSPSVTYNLNTPIPAVTGLSPVSGTSAGGTAVTVTGYGFTGATDVKFGATDAGAPTVVNDNSLTINSPAGSIGAVVDVTVTGPGGTSRANAPYDQFTYTGGTAPTVTSLDSTTDGTDFGSTAGGQSVNIGGTHLDTVTAVKFGTTAAASFTLNTASAMTAVAPAHAAGALNITVTNPSGTSPTATANQYSFVVVPVPSQSARRLLAINQVASVPMTSGQAGQPNNLAGSFDEVNLQPQQLAGYTQANSGLTSVGGSSTAAQCRAVNSDLIINQYVNGPHQTRDGELIWGLPYTPPGSWYLLDVAGNKVFAGNGSSVNTVLMFPRSTAGDGHGHLGWGAWRNSVLQNIAADTINVWSGAFVDVISQFSIKTGTSKAGNPPLDPATNTPYLWPTWLTDMGTLASELGNPFPAGGQVILNSSENAAGYLTGGGSGANTYGPVKSIVAAQTGPKSTMFEIYLRNAGSTLVGDFPGHGSNGTGTWAQWYTALDDAFRVKGAYVQVLLKLMITATNAQIDQWNRVAMAMFLLAYQGLTSGSINFQCSRDGGFSDVVNGAFGNTKIGGPTDNQANVSGNVFYRHFANGLVFLNTDTVAHTTPIALPRSPGAVGWTDVGPAVTYPTDGTNYPVNPFGGHTFADQTNPTIAPNNAMILRNF